MTSTQKNLVWYVLLLLSIVCFGIMVSGCSNNAPNAYQSAASQYKACLQNSADVGQCERAEKNYRFERDQATIRQNDAVSSAARQQQLFNSMATYRAFSSPCGIGTPCR